MAFRDVRAAENGEDSLAGIKIERMDYLFLLVVTNPYRTHIVEELERQLGPFGDDLGDRGMVVRTFESASAPAADGVIGRPGWPAKIGKRFAKECDPFMLVIGTDLGAFRPDVHPWSILWFSDYCDQPASIYRLFAHLARIARDGGDIHDYLAKLAKRKTLDKHLGAVHFRPSIAGISIDVDRDNIDPLEPSP
jgi:hypothetical protein